RRHTRCYRDWSSDVCSSDLIAAEMVWLVLVNARRGRETAPFLASRPAFNAAVRTALWLGGAAALGVALCAAQLLPLLQYGAYAKIGRASCRERGATAVGAAQ